MLRRDPWFIREGDPVIGTVLIVQEDVFGSKQLIASVLKSPGRILESVGVVSTGP